MQFSLGSTDLGFEDVVCNSSDSSISVDSDRNLKRHRDKIVKNREWSSQALLCISGSKDNGCDSSTSSLSISRSKLHESCILHEQERPISISVAKGRVSPVDSMFSLEDKYRSAPTANLTPAIVFLLNQAQLLHDVWPPRTRNWITTCLW